MQSGRLKVHMDAIQNMVQARGWHCDTAFLVDDCGSAMDIFSISIWLRYLELCGESVELSDDMYHGDYVFDFAATVHRCHGHRFHRTWDASWSTLSAAALTAQVRQLMGDELDVIAGIGRDAVLADIQKHLGEIGNEPTLWFYRSDVEAQQIQGGPESAAVVALRELGLLQYRSGDTWLVVGEEEIPFQSAGQLSQLAVFIVVCYMVFRNGYTHFWFLADTPQQADCLHRVVAGMVPASGQVHIKIGYPGQLHLTAGTELLQADIAAEDGITLRELLLLRRDGLVKAELLSERLESSLQIATDHAAPAIHMLHTRQHRDFAPTEGIGINIESIFHEWQDLLRVSPQQLNLALEQWDPGIWMAHLCRLAKFTETHYNAQLPEPVQGLLTGLLQQSREQIQQGMAVMGIQSPE
ncbi:MAG: hypothetical protein OEZ68_03290 [Gammaproteobacteria bacterium]|nr:hypothetical protein [Gammaproteobacteria bacterium]MDH5799808.1 hypothetical protein [Gammaproteobacteria bacterium]